MEDLEGYFEQYISQASIFKNKSALQANYTPSSLRHRDEQFKMIARVIAPLLRFEKPSNLFIYGKTGTGKTVTTRFVVQQLEKTAQNKQVPLKAIYINCKLKKVADTEYRLLAQLVREFGKIVPPTGLPTDEVYQVFYSAVDADRQMVLLVLDEIDQLVGKIGDDLLYNLTRMNTELKRSLVSIVGISNNVNFSAMLDPRVKSSLAQEELVFSPYNALQIQDILHERCGEAFREGVVEAGVIEKCAAFAAREHGDARRALELMRVAGELAERDAVGVLSLSFLDSAEAKIERDTILDAVKHQPRQFQVVLCAIFRICEQRKEVIFTGEVYDVYQQLCLKLGLRPLTQRRISDVLAEMDMLGIITARVVSKGRYGRTREIGIAVSDDVCSQINQVLEEELRL